MRSIAVNEQYDIYLDGSRNLAMAVDKKCVDQDVRLASYMFLGEFPFNTTLGVDYMGTLFQDKNPYAFEASLRANILRVPNVSDINSLRILQTSDTLQYEVTVESTYGQVNL